MRHFPFTRALFATSLLSASLVLAGCGSAPMLSRWQQPSPPSPADSQDWLKSATLLEDHRASVALFNDSEYVYLWLVTSDRDLQRQITRGGLTCWFDREGGGRKSFGIHYPLFTRPAGAPERGQGEERDPMTGIDQEDRSVEGGDMDVYTSGEENPVRMSTAATAGIDARYRESRGTLMYGLRVPLSDRGAHPFAINALPGTRIGIGLETGVRRATGSGMENGARGGEGGRGEGGRRGGFGRGGRGGPRPDTAARPDPLKDWLKVDLAKSAQ